MNIWGHVFGIAMIRSPQHAFRIAVIQSYSMLEQPHNEGHFNL